MSNYTTKPHLTNAAGVDTSKFAKKANLTSWKLHVGKLDNNKLAQ